MSGRKTLVVLSIVLLLATVPLTIACGKPSPTTSPATTTATATTATATTAAPKPVTPQILTWGVLDVGSTGYTASGFAAESIRDKSGVPVRLIPVGNDVGRLTLARSKQIQALNWDTPAYNTREGVADFANRAWGPQRLRMLYQLTGSGTISGMGMPGNSPVRTAKDLKGKNMPFVVGFTAHNTIIDGVLAFAGLTWNDVVKVEIPSYAASIDAVVEGKTAVALVNTTSANAVRIAAGPGGLRYLPMPASDVEGWKRFHQFSPASFPAMTTDGPGLSASNPAQAWSTSNVWDSYDFLDNDIAYFTTKALAESFPMYKDKHERLRNGAVDQVLNIVGGLPYAFHPGSIKYFKEIGKWTPQLETWNQKVLDREDKLLKAWEACLAEADTSKLTEDKIPALWDKYRKTVPPVE